MSHFVTVTTGARLHLGLFAPRRERGRRFGGCGMMIDGPGCEVVVEASPVDRIDADPASIAVVETARDRLRSRAGLEGAVSISVRRCVPRHAGLGSGTQLALAVAAGIAGVTGHSTDALALAQTVGRGRRSAVGVHGFAHGGFLVDDGALPGERLGALAERIAVPEDWRIVLVTPHRQAGRSGASEVAAFEALPPTPEVEIAALRRLVDRSLVPALRAGEFGAFTEAVHEYGRRAGALFAPVQGGVYSHPETEGIVDGLRQAGIRGIGQTSWGPTVFAFTRHEVEAGELAKALQHQPLANPATVVVARPRNVGATIA